MENGDWKRAVLVLRGLRDSNSLFECSQDIPVIYSVTDEIQTVIRQSEDVDVNELKEGVLETRLIKVSHDDFNYAEFIAGVDTPWTGYQILRMDDGKYKTNFRCKTKYEDDLHIEPLGHSFYSDNPRIVTPDIPLDNWYKEPFRFKTEVPINDGELSESLDWLNSNSIYYDLNRLSGLLEAQKEFYGPMENFSFNELLESYTDIPGKFLRSIYRNGKTPGFVRTSIEYLIEGQLGIARKKIRDKVMKSINLIYENSLHFLTSPGMIELLPKIRDENATVTPKQFYQMIYVPYSIGGNWCHF